ncbi:MAG: zinc ribbon domain-containing protein [Pyrinomonadaceae bacterium]|nr:zinc ribbon domain-containing protein [Pyrinomonadaceae bacterium]
MYCPRCSQQQVSEETKFCSRCGFPLGLISEILSHGGFLPQLAELYKSKKWVTRKNGVLFSIMWTIFFLLIMTPFWGIVNVDRLAGVSAIIGIFGGLMWLIASMVLLKSEPQPIFMTSELPDAKVNSLYQANQRGLPPQKSQPVQSYVPPVNSWKAPNTGEFSIPGSVTEGTTKLLQKDEE